MNLFSITDLFGHSIYNPVFDDIFKECKITCKDKNTLDKYTSLLNKSAGIIFSFWHKDFFLESIGIPKSIYKSERQNEVILFEMTFKKGRENILLPFKLQFGDSSNLVTEKIGIKPMNKSKNAIGETCWDYYNANLKIMAVFDNDKKLHWFRIWSLSKAERKRLELKENLKIQNKNLTLENFNEILALKLSKPNMSWQDNNRDFQNKSIMNPVYESGIILDNFIDSCIESIKKKSASLIYTSIKKCVIAFNKLNIKYSEFICTDEREDLVNFIMKIVKMTGFKINKNIDLAEDWREW